MSDCKHEWVEAVTSVIEYDRKAHGNSFPMPIFRCSLCNETKGRKVSPAQWRVMERQFYGHDESRP